MFFVTECLSKCESFPAHAVSARGASLVPFLRVDLVQEDFGTCDIWLPLPVSDSLRIFVFSGPEYDLTPLKQVKIV